MDKIKADAFKEYIEDNFEKTSIVTIGDVDIEVRHHLSMSDMIDFVENVSSACFQGEDNRYIPELKDFLIRTQIIKRYTNIELPDDLNEQYDFLYTSDIIGKIVEAINQSEFKNMLHAIECKVDNIEEVSFGEYRRKMDEIYSSLMSLTDQTKKMYEGMSADDMADIMKAFAGMLDGTIDEESLVKVLMSQKERG